MRNRIAKILGLSVLIVVTLVAQQAPPAPAQAPAAPAGRGGGRGAGGGGGVALTGGQIASIGGIDTLLQTRMQAVTAARTALIQASYTLPVSTADLSTKAQALAAAELALAIERADAFVLVQGGADRLSAAQIQVVVTSAGRGGTLIAAAAGGGGGAPAVANPNGVRIFIRAGLKSHAEGQHDYPQFLADWSKLLTDRGARVSGGLEMPSAKQLAATDVVVFYKGDAGYLTDEEKADLDAFVKRGGGVVSLHDALCGPDPVYFATIFGGAKRHGETNFSQGDMKYTIVDKADPIMKGMTDWTLPRDEAFKLMTWAPTGLHVLATVPMPTGTPEVVPQIWSYEHTVPGGEPARAFAWMQGHLYANFADPVIREMLLRGISWAAKKPVDTLATTVARQGGRGVGGSDIVVPGQ